MEADLNIPPAIVEESAPSGAQQTSPLVSILIRSMGREFLAQALDSVALQTYSNIEVVVLAVRPEHPTVGDRCGQFPLRLVPTNQPVQRSAAANRAMAAARGEFLIFLDDDDWMMPGHVARLAAVLIKRPNTLAAYSGIELVDVAGRPLGQNFDLPFDPIRQLAGNLMPIHAVLFRATVLSQGCRFDESLDRLEDWDFWLQLAKLAPMVHLPDVSAIYRIHDSSGVHDDAGPQGAASQRIYQKWEASWTPQQLAQIMQRVWTHSEMAARLTDAGKQLSAVEQQLISDQSLVAEQAACIAQHAHNISEQASTIAQQASTIAQQTSTIAQQALALAQQQLQVNALTHQVEAVTASLAHSENERTAIMNSSIWRVTQPLRSSAASLKRLQVRSIARRALRIPRILIAEGPLGLIHRIMALFAPTPVSHVEYRDWAKAHDSLSEKGREQLRKTIGGWQHKPLISIIMPVYNPPLDLFEAAIASIQGQIYPHWELCIADDASPDANVWRRLQKFVDADHRIKAVRRPSNGHISQASNSALELASGEFIALMDNDDLLAPDALYWLAEAVNRCPTVKIIYSDEDRLDAHGERYGAYFKPDWNYTLFLGHNLISHLGAYHTQLVREVGGFRTGLEGSQDYDLALRCIEKLGPSQIVHIPKVLYHWRAIAGSTALSIDAKSYALDAAQRALQEHLVRTGSDARVQQLPTLDYKCVRSHGALKDGLSVVLVCPAGSSQDHEALAWTRDPAYAVREVLTCTDQGASINAAVASAQGALVALVAVHLCPREPAALLDLAGHALEAKTGAAAGTVRDASGLLVSGGLVLNQTTIASVLHKDLPAGNHGYAGRGFLSQELSALSMDCVVLRKEVFALHGGWDVDLGIGTLGAVAWCVRLREKGYRMVWCPDAAWTTCEASLPRSPTATPAHRKIFMHRYGSLCAQWLQRDPAYHPRLDPVTADFSLVG